MASAALLTPQVCETQSRGVLVDYTPGMIDRAPMRRELENWDFTFAATDPPARPAVAAPKGPFSGHIRPDPREDHG